jgi:3-carboxy-cis,cis-muconate cycloisomerase
MERGITGTGRNRLLSLVVLIQMATESNSPFFSSPAMDRVFSRTNQLRQMVRFEWALSVALESAGIAREGTAAALEPFLTADFVDGPELDARARSAGNLAIPFVGQLTAAVRGCDEEAARLIHLGATSQDVLDTALVLQIGEALKLIDASLRDLDEQWARLARAHAGTVLTGRTWLQAGPPVTLGLKIAGWLAALRRHRQRLESISERALVLQFGGAVGTLAALGDTGMAVSAVLAQKLNLREPELPWHTHRDNLVEVATVLGLLAGTLGKVARDVSLLMQTEVAEVSEPAEEGRGGSSTMPHKRNPVASAIVLSVATRVPGLVATLLTAMVQEHERGLGNWQAEWETLPEIFRLTAAALDRTLEIARGMRVDPEKMAANLEAARGLPLAEAVSVALAVHLGRERAHDLVQRASMRAVAAGRHLREILVEDVEIREHLNASEIDRLMDPGNYLGSARIFIARVLGDDQASH